MCVCVYIMPIDLAYSLELLCTFAVPTIVYTANFVPSVIYVRMHTSGCETRRALAPGSDLSEWAQEVTS